MTTVKTITQSALILGADIRPCGKCGQPTHWRTPRQPKKGLCPDHAKVEPADDQQHVAAALMLANAFEGTTISVFKPTLMPPGWYATVPTRVVLRGTFRRQRHPRLRRRRLPAAGLWPLRRLPRAGTPLRPRRPPVLRHL